MGKSPAKWIKTVLFGKKSSKSSLSKNVAIEKRAATNASVSDPVPLILNTPRQIVVEGAEKTDIEFPRDVPASLSAKESMTSEVGTTTDEIDNAEVIRQEEAATKAQAAFRGYLARRAFRALKGIIRLQALIRGHLVRRQAVATLHCMQAIVKFQAVARGRRVRVLYPGLHVLEKYRLQEVKETRTDGLSGLTMSLGSQKIVTSAFVMKLHASLPAAMPLSLQYDLSEPNSAWNWLERWSLLRFWEPVGQQKKNPDGKARSKQFSAGITEMEGGRPRRTAKKVSTVANSDNTSTDVEKRKRNLKKVSHQTESVPEQPQNELERVKRSLRKVSASTAVATEKPEMETEKAHDTLKKGPRVTETGTEKTFDGPSKISSPSVANVPDQVGVNSVQKLTDSSIIVENKSETEAPPKPSTVDELADLQHDDHPAAQHVEKGGTVEINTAVDGELNSKEDQTSKENQKTRRRSLPAKQEYAENVSQNTPSLPSYMAATESAKAKLRAQASLRSDEDGNGTENGVVRRHSLPSANGKLASLSPRVQRPLQAHGKGGNKSNKPLTSSRDGNDKALQPGWKR